MSADLLWNIWCAVMAYLLVGGAVVLTYFVYIGIKDNFK